MSRSWRANVSRILVLVLVVLSLPGAGHAAPPSTLRDDYADEYMAVTLATDSVPNLGGTATLTFTAMPRVDAPDLTVRWLVPEGVELLGDAEQSFGAVAPLQPVQVTRQLRFPNEGTFQITVNAVFHWGEIKQFGASGVLFFKVRATDSLVSELDPDLAEKERIPDQVTFSFTPDDSLSDPNAPNDICVTVQGTIRREEHPPLPGGGYGPTVIVPVRAGIVEIREEDIVFDDSYAEKELIGLPYGDGHYSHRFCDDDGWFDDELEIYIRIQAEGSYGEVENYGTVWDDVYDINIKPARSIDRSGTVTIDVLLNEQHSAIFNILEAVRDAHYFFNLTRDGYYKPPTSQTTVNVNWERGKGYNVSRYRDTWDEIIISDNPSEPDEWDDTVIIHEWGHFADDIWSCDENPGGAHNFGTLLADAELSFGEAYPDYYQSVVRQWRNDPNDPNHSRYIDARPGGGGFSVDFEPWNVPNNPANPLVSIQTEDANAAALWDLHDNAVDGSDTVAWGHAVIQSVYLSDDYEDADNCNWRTFQRAWQSTGKPTDGPTGQTIVQNVGASETFATRLAAAELAAPDAAASVHALGPGEADWWDKLVFVVDNSASMAGGKFQGVKAVLDEAVNDLGQSPQGTEFSLYTFNNSGTNQLLTGRFFPEDITPVIAGLNTVGGPDASCPVSAFPALAQAVDKRYGVDAWVLTDGDTTTFAPTVEGMKSILLNRRVRASFAVMGVCPTLSQTETPDDPGQTQENANLLRGMARTYLGLAADPTPGGIVPYLLTAIGSGGQFLWVSPGYEQLAGEILRAQMTHSAGAGRWSDYVSNTPTYRFDTLASWEYQWIDGATQQVPAHVSDPALTIALPQLFTLFGSAYYGTIDAYQDGYLVLGPYGGPRVKDNTPLPNPAQPNNALYPFWDDLSVVIPPNAQTPQFGGLFGQVYTAQQGDWFVIEYSGFKRNLSDPGVNFEVLLNLSTYEVRYQYKDVPGGAGSATIGLENADATNAVQITYNDINGARNNMGYKFVPAPPQPSKTYTVAVDSLMQGVGFLLTGYDVGFSAGLTVRDPNGVPVNCAEQGTLCLYLGGRVQYVQVNVNGRTGVWTATVEANGPGTHTFSFSSMAAGALPVRSRGRHVISTVGGARVLLDLGQPVDGNVLTGWLLQPTNRPLGGEFMLYDDGQHNDEGASDGIFGSDLFTPGAPGIGYLRVKGTVGGVEFVRSDPAPYLFQPLRVQPLGDGVNMGGSTSLTFRIINDDAFSHCYNVDVRVPAGWTATVPNTAYCLGPSGTTLDVPVTVWLAATGQNNDLASGTSGTVTFSVVENEKGSMSASAQAEVSRHRPPASINIHNLAPELRPNGDQATVRVSVYDEQQVSAADGTPVQITSSLGTVNPANGTLLNGWLYFTFTTGPETGDALITVSAGSAQATTTIRITEPAASQLALAVEPTYLPADGASTAALVATVKDKWGNPSANQLVRIGVTQDGQFSTIGGSEVVTGTTDANGQFSATLTAAAESGVLSVRAELMVLEAEDYRAAHDASQTVVIGASGEYRLYLPMLRWH